MIHLFNNLEDGLAVDWLLYANMSGPLYISSNIHKCLQNKREPSMPVAFSISVLSRDRKSKAFSSRMADPSNLRPVMHQSKIAVETKCNSIKLAFLNIRSLKNKSFVINDLKGGYNAVSCIQSCLHC